MDISICPSIDVHKVSMLDWTGVKICPLLATGFVTLVVFIMSSFPMGIVAAGSAMTLRKIFFILTN